jgi:hypothetical protein
MAEFNLMPQVLPTIQPGPDGTICIAPGILREVVAFDDAIKLGLVCFVAGLLLMYGFWQLDICLKARGK